MSLFLQDVLRYSFLQYALLAGLLGAIACGIVGSFVVVRHTTYIAGAIAHSVLGGMGAARYLERVHGLEWATPLVGATVAAIVAALLIAWVTLGKTQRQDTVLSAIWAIGMAVGISCIAATPGYYEDLMSYLFGNILMVSPADLWMMAVLNLLVVVLTVLFYDKFLAISFQPELARLRGISVPVYEVLLLLITALTVVLLTQVVGLILVIALLSLPAAIAGQIARRLWVMMLIATVLCLFFVTGGLALSYAPELPPGATIIELAGGTYLLALLGRRLRLALMVRRQNNGD